MLICYKNVNQLYVQFALVSAVHGYVIRDGECGVFENCRVTLCD